MGAAPKIPRFAGVEAFLAWEDMAPERHEFVDGQAHEMDYAVAGATHRHGTIVGNASIWLREALRGTPGRVYCFEVMLAAAASYLYPDAMVTCDLRDHPSEQHRFVRYPWLVIEVLSDSTAADDRGRKFELYRGIGTLTHYLLVEQSRPHADLFFKNPQGQWVLQPLSIADTMQIDRLGQPWPVASLYDDVEFPPAGRSAGMPPPIPDPGR